jgi:hypothetical protein
VPKKPPTTAPSARARAARVLTDAAVTGVVSGVDPVLRVPSPLCFWSWSATVPLLWQFRSGKKNVRSHMRIKGKRAKFTGFTGFYWCIVRPGPDSDSSIYIAVLMVAPANLFM